MKMAIAKNLHEISNFLNDNHEQPHSQIPTMFRYCEWHVAFQWGRLKWKEKIILRSQFTNISGMTCEHLEF